MRNKDAKVPPVMQRTHRRRLRLPPENPPPVIENLVRERWAAALVGCAPKWLQARRDAGELSCWLAPNGQRWYDRDELATLFTRTHVAGVPK
jgi:hypothetical protein